MLIRAILYIVLLFFILQIDAYLYLLDIIVIEPFVQTFLAAIFVTAVYVLHKPLVVGIRLSREATILLFCFATYIGVQILGVAVWDTLPDDSIILVYWVYMIMLLFLGVVTGALIEDRIFYFSFALLVIFSAMIVIDAVLGGISVSEQWGRPAATMRNPNDAAFLLVLLLLGSMRWQQLTYLEVFAIVIAGAAIALTQSRGGLLAYIILIAFYAVWWGSLGQTLNQRAKRYMAAFFFAIVIVGATLTALLIRRYSLDGVDNILSATLSDPNLRDRAIIDTWYLIVEQPLLGYGTGYSYTMEMASHVMLLKVWLDNGVLGVLVFFMLFFGLFWLGLSRKDNSIMALVGIFLVISLTTHNLMESRSLLIITGLLLAGSARKSVQKRRTAYVAYR